MFFNPNFENENPRKIADNNEKLLPFEEAQDFNEFWDELFGEFEMGDYSYMASEVL